MMPTVWNLIRGSALNVSCSASSGGKPYPFHCLENGPNGFYVGIDKFEASRS